MGAAAVLGIAALLYALSRRDPSAPRPPPEPPAAARDPANPAVFVPGGVFLRGSRPPVPGSAPEGPRSVDDEMPARPMEIEPFWMQTHEVTHEEYRRFDPDHTFPAGHERHPVANLTYGQALAYAMSVGGTLPSEWQWEFAARGTQSRIYPWGNEPPDCRRAHFEGCSPEEPIEVMSLPRGATPEGIHELAGNVAEWVTPHGFVAGRTPVNPEVPRTRGGSFADDAFFLRAANRNRGYFPEFRQPTIGFRVVWPVP